MFAVSRIAHYLKSDDAGQDRQLRLPGQSWRHFLQRLGRPVRRGWMTPAISGTKAPLPAARGPDRGPARFQAGPESTVPSPFLRPHFQLDELSVSLRLVAELPQGRPRS
ncbi:MAG: hypothetical protein MZV70_63270 [Desulfobacterales bacterium]|nr:hypothetical protein [Desulfobacterales bacterium]